MPYQQGIVFGDDDRSILARLVEGDQEALALLYNRYGMRIYSVALHVTNDQASAEEITQDIFEWLWSNASRYDIKRGRLEPWLSRIAHNRAVDWLRSRHGANRQRELPLPDVPPPDETYDLARQIQQQIDIQSALSQLLPDQRSAIELTFHCGWSPKEIAERQGCPLPTVYTRLRVGMDKLRAIWLNGEEGKQ